MTARVAPPTSPTNDLLLINRVAKTRMDEVVQSANPHAEMEFSYTSLIPDSHFCHKEASGRATASC